MEETMNKHWDLIVVGGGLTGVAAAVSARRLGLSVLLIEKAGYLGGAPSTMLVNPFMPYHTKVNGEKFLLSRGFFTELRTLLAEEGGYRKQGGEDLHEEYLKLTLDRLVKKEDVDVLFHAFLCDVEKDHEHIQSVSVATKAGTLRFNGDIFIDATGDADFAMLAGCPYALGREDGLCQPMTLCFRIGNVNLPDYKRSFKMMQKLYKEFQSEGRIKNPRENILIFNTLVDNVLHFNTTRIVKMNPVNPFDVTQAEMEAREQMFELYHFLKENVPGFENSQLLYSAPEIGVRESRKIIGEYVLTEEDLVGCVQFEDRIAAGNYDIDIHNPEGSGTSHYYFEDGTWYTIPYRSLLPKEADNLLVAGRCISTTHEAQASIRILPIVTTLGEAAGVAAAVCKQNNTLPKEVDITMVQQQLEKQGAFIG